MHTLFTFFPHYTNFPTLHSISLLFFLFITHNHLFTYFLTLHTSPYIDHTVFFFYNSAKSTHLYFITQTFLHYSVQFPGNALFNPFIPADQKRNNANSADLDETACNEPSHQDLHCLSFALLLLTFDRNP